MKYLMFVCLALAGTSVFGLDGQYHLNDASLETFGTMDVVAPVVSSESDVSDKQAGMIIYDASANVFKGYKASGSWVALSSGSGSPVSSGAAGQRVERAIISNSGSASITSQSGSWLSSVTRNGTGDIALTIATSVFSSAPTCVCSGGPSNSNISCSFSGTMTSTSIPSIITRNVASSGSVADANVMIICMGQ